MVKVSNNAAEKMVAWRVRDAMARHPSLNSASARIDVRTERNEAGQLVVVLHGWTLDEQLHRLAFRLAMNATACPVQIKLATADKPETKQRRKQKSDAAHI
ncbi:MAG: hypothetical protein KDE46_14830 [Caldilineaceae bacterium]|nr:hypothetical protein [Caldilineaceae bacterium]